MGAARQAAYRQMYEDIRHDHKALCRYFRVDPTWQQREALEDVYKQVSLPKSRDNPRRLSIRSGQGAGKTSLACLIGAGRTLGNVNSLTVVTAPTRAQLQDVWFTEFSRMVAKADPLVRSIVSIQATKANICGRRDWTLLGRTSNRVENFQGFHHKKMTIIVDEASGIQRPQWEAIQGTLGNKDSFLLAIGNPNSRSGVFYESHTTSAHLWNCMRFSSLDSPLYDPETAKQIEEEHGKTSDVYRVRVEGEFPSEEPDTIMQVDDVIACMGLDPRNYCTAPRQFSLSNEIPCQVGLDVARFGGDENVFYFRQGNAVLKWGFYAHTDPNEVADRVMSMQRAELLWRDRDTVYVMDTDGMGQGVVFRFQERDRTLVEFHTNNTPHNPLAYKNALTEAWFDLRTLVRERRVALPRDRKLQEQLVNRKYMFRHGKIEVESKDTYKSRGFASPDRADALVMAFYDRSQGIVQVGASRSYPSMSGFIS